MQIETQVAPSGSDRIWSILSHVSAWIGLPILLPLVVYIAMRHESDYVATNAREALNFHITLFIYTLCCVPLVFVVVGVPLLILLSVAAFILTIIAAVKAVDGACYRYPVTLRLV